MDAAVPTSDAGDEVGGILDDGTRLGAEHTTLCKSNSAPHVSASERIRAEAQQRVTTQDEDEDIVSPGTWRLKALCASSDESDVELSPTKRPKRRAAQHAPPYNVKLSLTQPASADAQKRRGLPQPLTQPSNKRAPRSIATLLRQKHARHRKGLDHEGLERADALAANDPRIAYEIAVAQDRMNAAQLAQDKRAGYLEHALPESSRTELLQLLHRDSAEAQGAIAPTLGPMVWTTATTPPCDSAHWSAELLAFTRNRTKCAGQLTLGMAELVSVSRHELVAWLIHELITHPEEDAAPTALLDLAHAAPDACRYFWDALPHVMRQLGADAALLPLARPATAVPKGAPCAPSRSVHRFWRTCVAMPRNDLTATHFPLLVLYAATLPASVDRDQFLLSVGEATSMDTALTKLVAMGRTLAVPHRLQLVRAVPGRGLCRSLRADLAVSLLTPPSAGAASPRAVLQAYCSHAARAPERHDTTLRAELDLLSYALDVPRLLAHEPDLPGYVALLSALASLDQSIHDHRGTHIQRSACKDTLQRLQLRVRYQIQACVEHDPRMRASWTALLQA